MTTQTKVILSAVLAFIAAVILNLQTLSGVIKNVLESPPGPVASAGNGGAPSAGRGASTAGKPASGSGGVGGTVVPSPSRGMVLGTQSWFVASWSGNNLFAPGVNFATTTNPWNPQFLADLKPYKVWRHMDMNATNSSKQVSWSTRKLPTDSNQTAYGATDGDGGPGIAYEWQIDLCNKAHVDCWFNVPHRADDDYVKQLAALISAKIDPSLKVYVEYSNETANGAFTQFAYVNQQGVALGLPGQNQWYQGSAFAVYRTLQIGKIFRDVKPITLVFAYMGNLDTGAQALKMVLPSAKWNPTGQKIDMLAVAPYVAAPGTDGTGFTLAAWKTEVDKLANGEPIANAIRDSKVNGIPLIGCYEGGQTYYSNSSIFAKNPQAYDAYKYMLDSFAAKGVSVFTHYTLYGTWGASAWGAFDHTGQALTDVPKARALGDWAGAH